jgi:hypothetical protein
VSVSAKMPKEAGLFTRALGLLVYDEDGLRRVNFRMTGRSRKETGGSPVAHEGR